MATTQALIASETPQPVLTLAKVRGASQAVQQWEYDPAVIDQAVMLGDMKKMSAEMRLEFYRAVCLSVGLNPLTQPFTPLERQDKTTWLYANSVAAQQLAALHHVSFQGITRRQEMIAGEPFYFVELTASLPDGRSLPAQGIVSLTKKKKVQRGTWEKSGDPKFVDAVDEDGEPILIPLRGEALANAMMKCDTKAHRRATLALVGLGWMMADAEGRALALDMQTGAFKDPREEAQRPRLLDEPSEAAKSRQQHAADLYGDGEARDPIPPSTRAQVETSAPPEGVGDTPVPESPLEAPGGQKTAVMDETAFAYEMEKIWTGMGMSPDEIQTQWAKMQKRCGSPIPAKWYGMLLDEQRHWAARRQPAQAVGGWEEEEAPNAHLVQSASEGEEGELEL